MNKLIIAYNAAVAKHADTGFLVLRILAGLGFFFFGYKKMLGFDGTVGYFEGLGIPMPTFNAVMATGTELVGGALLTLGLGTRIVVVPMAITMIVALATAHSGSLTSVQFFREIATIYLGVFVMFLTMGGGKHSLDAKLGLEKIS